MKQRLDIVRGIRSVGATLALGAAVFGWHGCAETSAEDPGSGETHFLGYCSSSCAEGLECVCGVCTRPCEGDDGCTGTHAEARCIEATCSESPRACDVECSASTDCAGLGADYRCEAGRCRPGSAGGDAAPPTECAPGCSPVFAQVVNEVMGCVESSTETDPPFPPEFHPEFCDCGNPEEAEMPECHRRVADGAAFVFGAAALADPSAWELCTPEQLESASSSCVFTHCAVPPPSLCNAPDTCAALGCGGFEFDENGCQRAECLTDEDCTLEERCVFGHLTSSFCAYWASGACQCSGLTIDRTGYRCNSTTIAGPRGEWLRFEVTQWNGPCAPGATCQWTRSITPDGNVELTAAGVASSAALTAADLELLRAAIEGIDLRLALRDGIACDPPPTDVGVTFRLALDTETLEREATGCAISGPDGNIFGQLYQMVLRYQVYEMVMPY